MIILKNLIVGLLTTYLALINTLGDKIDLIFNHQKNEVEIISKINKQEPSLTVLPSNNLALDILRNNPLYQQANLIETNSLSGGNTQNPNEAIVNIVCTIATADYIKTTTGTGFFIDPDGIILTNAHVAQFLLLEHSDEKQAECIVRGGNPAVAKYHAELLYISPTWISQNASKIYEEHPLGTGERDYALLYVTNTVTDEPLPAIFPSLSLYTKSLPTTIRGENALVAGYPANNMLENGADSDLKPILASTSISELYTFGSNLADVFSVTGTTVGNEGASGGPVTTDDGTAIGLIVTRGDDTKDGAGSLRAITLAHIDRTITEETGFSLQENLEGDLAYRSKIFTNIVGPFLLSILEQADQN